MHDLNDPYFFVQIVEHGGFAAAGRALGIPKSRLSRRIAQLEERLGVRLLQRTTRKLALTEIGQQYLERCQAMLVEAQAAEDLIAQHSAEPRGLVRVSCPIPLVQSLLIHILPRFQARYPKVQIYVLAANRPVDLIEENIDVALRVRAKPEDSAFLVMRVFGESHTMLMASPDYLARAGAPSHPDELAGHDTLSMTARDNRPSWLLEHASGERCNVPLRPRLSTDEMHLLKASALAGLGIVLLPVYLCREELRDGSLVRVLGDWAPTGGLMHCVYPSRRGQSPAVRAFLDMLTEEIPSLASEVDIGLDRSRCPQ